MNYDSCRESFGVCGIDCSRCVSKKGGEVQQLSLALREALTNFENKAPAFAAFAPELKAYDAFSAVLAFLTQGDCEGCRSGQCHMPGCAAKVCYREKGVDFCFQCDEYPCSRNQFDPALTEKWRRNNDAMKRDGIEAFCLESKRHPRY